MIKKTTMKDIKFDSNIFSGGMLLKGSTKMSANLDAKLERLCSTCGNDLGKNKCKVLGKIKNPNDIHCSFWKEKLIEVG